MKLIISFVSVLLALIVPAFAQSNFKPGYIITLNDDTLRGQIDYRQWDRNPKEINFKGDGTSKIEKHNLYNSKGFNVSNVEQYERHIITASVAAVETWRLSTRDTTVRTDTAFLKVLASGPVAKLYEYTDALKTRFYIKQPEQATPIELLYQVFLSDDSSSQIITKYYYVNQLMLIAHQANLNDLKFAQKLNKSKYKVDDLTQFVNAINGVAETNRMASGSLTRFFVGAGINLQQLKYTGNILLAKNSQSSTAISPLLQAGIDFIPNKVVQKYFLRLELSYTSANMKVTTPSVIQTIDQRNISLSPQIIYNLYNTTKLKVHGGAGLVLNFSSYPKNEFTQNTLIIPTAIPATINMSSTWLGGTLHTGITLQNRFQFNFCYYALSTPLTDNYIAFKATPTIFQTGFKYLFN